MVWTRPINEEYPVVWHRFQGRRAMGDGSLPTFRIQDLPPDKFDEAVDFMCENFLPDEPTWKSLNAANDESSIKQLRSLWYHCLSDNVGLVCYREDPSFINGVCPQIIGLNVTCVAKEKDKNLKIKMEGDIFPLVMGALYQCMELVDVFKLYGVTEYLTATGLAVNKAHRGQNIGAEILRARVPLCKAIGIKVTSTVFTAIESQVLAKKVGFQENGGVSFEDLRDVYGYKLTTDSPTKSMKVMSLLID